MRFNKTYVIVVVIFFCIIFFLIIFNTKKLNKSWVKFKEEQKCLDKERELYGSNKEKWIEYLKEDYDIESKMSIRDQAYKKAEKICKK